MKIKSTGVAKWVALAVVPVSLAVLVAKKGQQRKAEAATKALLNEFSSICMGKPNVIEELISQGADVNAHLAKDGATPLHMALDYDYPQCGYESKFSRQQAAEFLLDHGAHINARDGLGVTCLSYAIFNGDVPCVRLLLQRGADVNAKGSKYSFPPLIGAEGRMGEITHSTNAFHPELTASDVAFIERMREIIHLLKAAGARE